MFAEDGYDLILGFRSNVAAAEKFKNKLLEKYSGQNQLIESPWCSICKLLY